MKKKLVFLGCFFAILITIFLIFFLPPKLEVKNTVFNYKEKYKNDFKVTLLGKDYTKRTTVQGKVNTKKLGTYHITYKTKTRYFTFTKKVDMKVVDNEKPKITLLGGGKTTYVCEGQTYKDEGAIAKDNYDGDITNKIKVKEEKNKITYTVTDTSDNKTTITRNLETGDIAGPELTLNGESTVYVTIGKTFKDEGIKSIDNCDGDITDKVVIDGSVNTDTVGTYTLKYTSIDKSKNKSEITREVKVIPNSGNGIPGTIYLTFDDGPNEGTTNVILDILKEEGVKATFFVTGKGPDYLIKREYEEGHTVALHTYSHSYQSIYSSVDAYMNDLNQISQRVKNITGYESKILRFPGGSSNTVSKKYSPGIMTKLSSEVTNRGYLYYDWNLASGDAGETTAASGVYSNVISRLKKDRANIILMHDIKTYTRDALRDIIKYGKNSGYTFEKITTDTAVYHQNINN